MIYSTTKFGNQPTRHQFCPRWRLEILSWNVENLQRKVHADVYSFDNSTLGHMYALQAHNLKAAGSNPAPATIKIHNNTNNIAPLTRGLLLLGT